MTIPIPQLDDTRFAALVEEARLLLPRYAPTWTDYNVHDPGITLLELFAWLSETQMYTLDQVTDWHMTKFLRLLGYPPRATTPARTAVTFRIPAGHVAVRIPQQTLLVGRRAGTDDNVFFETLHDLWVLPPEYALVAIERRSPQQGRMDLTEDWQRQLYVFALGGELGEAILAGTQLRLGFRSAFPPLPLTLTVLLYEDDLPPRGSHGEEAPTIVPSATVQWEYLAVGNLWRPLPEVVDTTQGLTVSGALHFTGPSDALPVRTGSQELYWLRMRVTRAGYELPPRLRAIHLNTVAAAEGRTTALVPIGCGTGLPDQRLTLEAAPVGPDSVVVQVREQPDGIWAPWTRVSDFDASTPTDRHFTLEAAIGVISFGNGFRGRIVPQGTRNIAVAYRSAGGVRGNLAAGEIRRVLTPGLEDVQVTNLQAASAGAEPESFSAAWPRLQADLATPYRTVTSEDFAALTLATPGLRVARAQALPGYDPQQPESAVPCLVTVVVVPHSLSDCPTPSPGFLATVCCHLDRHRLITTHLRVVAPRYVQVSIAAEVVVQPGSTASEVRRRVAQALTDFLHPLRGGVHKTGWPFGRAVYYSDLAGFVERVEGVECLTALHLQATEPGIAMQDDIVIPPDALVCAGRLSIATQESPTPCEVHAWPSHA